MARGRHERLGTGRRVRGEDRLDEEEATAATRPELQQGANTVGDIVCVLCVCVCVVWQGV